jgi:hydrophobe/amphiphile efflux-3 (HAE3) family protein
MENLRERIDSGFEVFGRSLYRNRIKSLLVMIAVIVGFVSQLPSTTFDTTNESYFHEDDPTLEEYNAFREQFGREGFVIIAIDPPDVFDRAFLSKLREFHQALEENVPFMEDITSLINARDTRGEGNVLIVEDLLETLPETDEDMARFKERVLTSPLYANFLISENGKFTTVAIETLAFSPGESKEDLLTGFDESAGEAGQTKGGEQLQLTPEENRALVQAVRKVAAEFEAPDFPLHVTGGPVMDEFFDRAMQQDMTTFLGLAVLAIGVFLLLLFRRFSGVVLPILVVILSLLSTIGLMAWTGTAMTMTTTILPSFLLAVGVGASVHILAVFFRQYQATGDKEGSLVFTMGHSGLPIVMTGLTTAAGLFAFSTAEMAPVAHLGIFGGTGVLISLVYTLVLIPAILALWPVRRHPRLGWGWRAGGFDRLLSGVADFATAHPWSITIAGAAIIVVAAIGLYSLKFEMNIKNWIPASLEIRQDIDLLDKELKGSISLEMIIDTGQENGLYDPAVMTNIESLGRFAEQYRNEGGTRFVGKTNSVVDVLKETNKALNENRQEFYTIPGTRELIAQELLLFENSGSDDLEQVVDSQFSTARLSITVPWGDFSPMGKFVDAMRGEAQSLFGDGTGITATGELSMFSKMLNTMIRSMARSYVIAAVVITLMMMALIGSFRLGLLSMVVNLSPILVTLGLFMGFNGIPLDVFTLMIGSIALGLAVDDTIHFFHNFRRYFAETTDARKAVRQTLLSTGRAMLFTTLVLVTGFWLFMLATMNNVFYFGLLTGVALILALLSDFLLAPALLTLVIRTSYGHSLTLRWCGCEPASVS